MVPSNCVFQKLEKENEQRGKMEQKTKNAWGETCSKVLKKKKKRCAVGKPIILEHTSCGSHSKRSLHLTQAPGFG